MHNIFDFFFSLHKFFEINFIPNLKQFLDIFDKKRSMEVETVEFRFVRDIVLRENKYTTRDANFQYGMIACRTKTQLQ